MTLDEIAKLGRLADELVLAQAEIDRLRGLLAEPTEAMVDAALQSWFATPRHLFSYRVVDDMRAALVAAGSVDSLATKVRRKREWARDWELAKARDAEIAAEAAAREREACADLAAEMGAFGVARRIRASQEPQP